MNRLATLGLSASHLKMKPFLAGGPAVNEMYAVHTSAGEDIDLFVSKETSCYTWQAGLCR